MYLSQRRELKSRRFGDALPILPAARDARSRQPSRGDRRLARAHARRRARRDVLGGVPPAEPAAARVGRRRVARRRRASRSDACRADGRRSARRSTRASRSSRCSCSTSRSASRAGRGAVPVSAYPLMLDGAAISALVVGGGAVAARKARALLDAGARVHVVAPEIAAELESSPRRATRSRITRARIRREHISATRLLVVAATNDADVNARSPTTRARRAARERRRRARARDFVTPAVHRAGDVVVAVTRRRRAGRGRAHSRRDRRVVDGRYAAAVRRARARFAATLLDRGDRERWRDGVRGARRRRLLRARRGRARSARRSANGADRRRHQPSRRAARHSRAHRVPAERDRRRARRLLDEHASAREAVLLSTCNRTELYLVEGEADAAPARLGRALASGSAPTRRRTATCGATARRWRISSASRAVSTRWCSARRRSMARCATRGRRAARIPGRCSTGCSRRRCSSPDACATRRRSRAARRRSARRRCSWRSRSSDRWPASARWCSARARWRSSRSSASAIRASARRSSPTAPSSARRRSPSDTARSRCTTTNAGRALADVDVLRLLDGRAARRRLRRARARRRSMRAATVRCASSTSRCRATSIRRWAAGQRLPVQSRRSAGRGLGESRAPPRRVADGRAADRAARWTATGSGLPGWRRCRC